MVHVAATLAVAGNVNIVLNDFDASVIFDEQHRSHRRRPQGPRLRQRFLAFDRIVGGRNGRAYGNVFSLSIASAAAATAAPTATFSRFIDDVSAFPIRSHAGMPRGGRGCQGVWL
jgi:hypothetical protein